MSHENGLAQPASFCGWFSSLSATSLGLVWGGGGACCGLSFLCLKCGVIFPGIINEPRFTRSSTRPLVQSSVDLQSDATSWTPWRALQAALGGQDFWESLISILLDKNADMEWLDWEVGLHDVLRPPRTVSQSGCPALPSPPSLATRVASGLCDGAVVTGSGGSCRGLTCVSLMTRDVDASSRTCRHLRVHVGGLSAQVSSPFRSGYVGFAGVDLEEFLIRRLVCRHPLLSGGWPLRSVNASLAAQSFPFALSRLVCSCFRCLGLWCHVHAMTLPTRCSPERVGLAPLHGPSWRVAVPAARTPPDLTRKL